jgi:hypothetical protein
MIYYVREVLEAYLFLFLWEFRENPINIVSNFFLFSKLIFVIEMSTFFSCVHALVGWQFLGQLKG